MYISRISPDDKIAAKVLIKREDLASRLAAIRSELTAIMAVPPGFGSAGPRRRQRDVDILSGLAADLRARLVAEMEAAR